MTFQQLASIDLNALNKVQLKSYVRIARDEWNRPIDLRTANLHDLIEYLNMFLQFKAEAENACEKIESVNELEAIEIEELPETPPSFNIVTRTAVDILLSHGTEFGKELTTSWFSEILCDCRMRSVKPVEVREKLILSDFIYYGLAGLELNEVGLFKRIVRSPEEFGTLSNNQKQIVNPYEKISNLIGGNAMSEMVVYHTIRDNLNYLQQLLSVSALKPKNYAIRDKLFATLDYDMQMVLTSHDRHLLRKETTRIAQYFKSITIDYKLYRELDDESLEEIDSNVDLVLLASTAEYCWLYSESHNWKPNKNGGFTSNESVKRIEPDRITLYYQNWDKSINDYSSFYRVVAYHPDPTRSPWFVAE